jgi:hypothetical protein
MFTDDDVCGVAGLYHDIGNIQLMQCQYVLLNWPDISNTVQKYCMGKMACCLTKC